MDPVRFDRLARALARPAGRRTVLAGLPAAVALALGRRPGAAQSAGTIPLRGSCLATDQCATLGPCGFRVNVACAPDGTGYGVGTACCLGTGNACSADSDCCGTSRCIPSSDSCAVGFCGDPGLGTDGPLTICSDGSTCLGPGLACNEPFPLSGPHVRCCRLPGYACGSTSECCGGLACAAGVCAAPVSYGDRVATDDLSLRSGPSPDAGLLAVVPAGSGVTLLGDTQGGYTRVDWSGLQGWLLAAYLA